MDRKEYLKAWRLANKEKTSKYNSNYYDGNRESILKKRQEKENNTCYLALWKQELISCECGKELKRGSIYKHRKSCVVYQRIHSILLPQQQS
ncbi:MAG: hypothetical protein ACOVOV_13735 [Dolichospermum sp.]|jgi:hypothetical protein